ncbi:MAG: dipeptide/oligopeptide/nickel ABC transporter ATP-binding protein [Rhizobiales bacterium]|nr:dipeptide/oligopeptide/nickel ABC transporter ATP-binding protein [Hyphomicrobiales bacterium]|tara:strand:+ start:5062 stop:6069 length:1008 start_codon:yes stop_codon:yes gene_type:complete
MVHETSRGEGAPLLEMRDVSVRLGRQPDAPALIENVNLAIQAGETVGLVGESGSGKTTLGMALLRLLPPLLDKGLSGEILYQDRDIARLGKNELAAIRGGEISMILQDPMASLNPVFSVGNQLREALRLHATASGSLEERAVAALESVKIPSAQARLANYPHQMSGGMRQRVVGAISLTRAPKLLIADEPTTSLDVTIQYQFLDLLKDLQRRLGMAMLFITHDFGVVARMCDRVAVMYAGEIVEQGPVRDIFARPAHWYTRALLDSVPTLDTALDRLPTIPGSPPTVGARPAGCRFHPRCANAQPQCRTAPPTVTLGAGHTARCWFPLGAQAGAA